MDSCPSCAAELTGRTLQQSLPEDPPRARRRHTRQLKRCPACQRLAWRADDTEPWADGGVDSSYDYLFDWEPKPLPHPWVLISGAEARAALEAELLAEVSEGHELFGQRVIAVARCGRCDEVLFSVETEPAWFAQVHLTWRHAEKPPWPWTERLSMPLADSLLDHTH